MNGYPKNRVISTTKSRSIDFSDLFSPPQTPKAIPNHGSKPQETKQIHNHSFPQQAQEEDGVGEIFGVILSRNRSVASASFRGGFSAQKQNSTLKSAVKRAFSMRGSSSVSEGYCRIYHQCDPVGDDDPSLTTLQSSSKKKGGKILKACRRLFGF